MKVPCSAAAFSAGPIASSGKIANMGMTARSWKSSTENELWPAEVFISPFSARDCNTMAVDDMASVMPMAMAALSGVPKTSAAAATSKVVASTWSPPRPRIGVRRRQSTAGSSSRPTRKSISTTPNSAKCRMSLPSCPTRPKTKGPIATPASR